MRLFEQPVRLSPVDYVGVGEYKLRKRLSEEEHDEFFDDSFHSDPREKDSLLVLQGDALDALCDRLYVLLGDAHTVGMGLLLPVAFRLVHESNMTKLWTEAEVQMAETTRHNLTFSKVCQGTRCYIARNQLGKVIKSPSYEPANLHDLIEELHGQELLSFDAVESAAKVIYGDPDQPTIEELMEEFGKDSEDEID